jgi:hypothetical protein
VQFSSEFRNYVKTGKDDNGRIFALTIIRMAPIMNFGGSGILINRGVQGRSMQAGLPEPSGYPFLDPSTMVTTLEVSSSDF